MTFSLVNRNQHSPSSRPGRGWAHLRGWATTPALLLLFLAVCGDGRASAPDFQLTQFDGNRFQLSEQKGQGLTVINFWYPSCPPCRAEMPAFQRAWQQLQAEGADVQFLGIFVPRGFDSEQDARDFVEEFGLTFRFATDRQARITQAFQVEEFPTTFFVDQEGYIFRSHISALDEGEIISTVRQMDQS